MSKDFSQEVNEYFNSRQKTSLEVFTKEDGFSIITLDRNSNNWITGILTPLEIATLLLIKVGMPVKYVWELLGYKSRYLCFKVYQNAIRILKEEGIDIEEKVLSKIQFKRRS